jgi:hypothetical protein
MPITHESLHTQNNKTKGNIKFLQLAAADAMVEVGTAVISTGL